MKIILKLFIIVFASTVVFGEITEEHKKAWKKFKAKHNRVFKNATREDERLKTFSNTLKRIETHNAKQNSHKIALNKFADISNAEFKKGHRGFIAPNDDYVRIKRAVTNSQTTTTLKPSTSTSTVKSTISTSTVKSTTLASTVKSTKSTSTIKPTKSTKLLSTSKPVSTSTIAPTSTTPLPVVVPDSFDWRTYGALSSVKDQGGCNSCWTFASTGALEAQIFIRKNKSVELSQQNLLDCAPNTNGCGGGANKAAYYYIQSNGGIGLESSYPYEGVQGKCRFNIKNIAGTCNGFTQSLPGDETAMKRAIYLNGPHSVAIDAGHDSFQLYASGIYYEPNCTTTNLDHAVLLVGYGTDAAKNDYWILKNSWGTDWGLNGYFYLARNKNNHCGISNFATCPIVV